MPGQRCTVCGNNHINLWNNKNRDKNTDPDASFHRIHDDLTHTATWLSVFKEEDISVCSRHFQEETPDITLRFVYT